MVTGGRSRLFQSAVTAYGLHGVGHLAASVAARDYTPGVLTSPLVVLPYALFARRRLRQAGRWQPTSTRDLIVAAAAVPPLVAGSHLAARWLTGARWADVR